MNKELAPPYVPQLSSAEDTSLFDEIFIKEPAYDTPCKTPLSQQHADAFRGFTFTRKNYITCYNDERLQMSCLLRGNGLIRKTKSSPSFFVRVINSRL